MDGTQCSCSCFHTQLTVPRCRSLSGESVGHTCTIPNRHFQCVFRDEWTSKTTSQYCDCSSREKARIPEWHSIQATRPPPPGPRDQHVLTACRHISIHVPVLCRLCSSDGFVQPRAPLSCDRGWHDVIGGLKGEGGILRYGAGVQLPPITFQTKSGVLKCHLIVKPGCRNLF